MDNAPEFEPRDASADDEIRILIRERARIEYRLRELIHPRLPRGANIAQDAAGNITAEFDPDAAVCSCLRCGYAWQPRDPSRLPRCCSRCGSASWMLPREDGELRDALAPDAPPSWSRRKRKQSWLSERVREVAARKVKEDAEHLERVVASRMGAATLHPVSPAVAATPIASRPLAFPPPPDISRIIPPPPSPSATSLSARLREFRAMDPSPEQPERVASMPAPPPPIIKEEPNAEGEAADSGAGERDPAEDQGAGTMARDGDVPGDAAIAPVPAEAPTPEVIPEYVPASVVGAPATDAEREELAKAREEAWPTTRSED